MHKIHYRNNRVNVALMIVAIRKNFSLIRPAFSGDGLYAIFSINQSLIILPKILILM